jgi:C4-dicarboxylate transporter DctQ subunit
LLAASGVNERPQSRAVLRGLKAFNDFIDRPVIVITNVLLLLSCSFICVEVITRYVFGLSQAFLEELSKNFMVWFVYLILAIVSKERGHVKIDALSRLLKGKSAIVADIIFHLSVVAVCIIIGIGMVSSIQAFYISGQTPATQFALPEWIIRLLVPVGLLFLVLRNIELVIEGVLALISKQGETPAV